jgi:23S rRNA (pseudouridine1915-N3)-methyltransferase
LKARLLAVGRFKSGAEGPLFQQYNARLRPPLDLVELPEARGSAAEIRAREGQAMLALLAPNALLVALDLGGEALSSEALAARTGRWEAAARPLVFAIGGAEGLDAAVTARAAERLSLGPPTWPHLLVRALLAEQLFRAQCIRANHPYHRGWRPA